MRMLCLSLLLLAGCSMTVQPTGVVLEEHVARLQEKQWQAIGEQLKKNQVPLNHQQLTYAVFQTVNECATQRFAGQLDMRLDTKDMIALWLEKFKKSQEKCQDVVLSQSLTLGGYDQAHAVSLALKSINPSFVRVVLPTYISVD